MLSQLALFNASMLGTSFLFSLILLISSLLKKNKTMMSTPFITVCFIITLLQLTVFLEWLWIPGRFPKALFEFLFVLEYILTYLSAAGFFWYTRTYIYALEHPAVHTRPAIEKKFMALVIIMCAVAAVIHATSLHTGWLYSFDENGNVTFTGAYALLFSFGGIWSVLTVLALLKHRRVFTTPLLILMLCYIVIPTLLILLDVIKDLSLGCTGTAIIFFLIYARIDNAQNDRLVEQKSLVSQREAEMAEANMKLMVSQIQPHFIFNVLGSIEQLCRVDAAKAETATHQFARYLRSNLNVTRSNPLSSFEEELKLIDSYVWLEKMRFGDDLQFEAQTPCSDFQLPLMSIQPLIENAVKHGMRDEEAAVLHVALRAEETPDAYVITVVDDGVGFDPQQPKEDGRTHVGLENVRSRIVAASHGTVTVQSTIGVGTTVTVTLPKPAPEA